MPIGTLGLVILGGGAAGTGPLIWAAQNGKLEEWLGTGIAIVERSDRMGGGIGQYMLNADSLAGSFVEFLDPPAARTLFGTLAADPATQQLLAMRGEYPTLALVGEHMRSLGSALQSIVTASPGGSFLPREAACAIQLRGDDTLAVSLASGAVLVARAALIALGGTQDPASLQGREIAPGLRLGEVAGDKLMPSDVLLTEAGIAAAEVRLAAAGEARVVIIGGSHSAFSAAWVLLNRLRRTRFGTNGVVLLHRRPPRVFYPSRAAAEADDYPFTEDDICPATGRVHRMGGLRNDGRELWRRLSSRPGAEPEPRMRMLGVADPTLSPAALRRLLDQATLVVPALGYRLNTLPVFDAKGRRLALLADAGGRAVDRLSRLQLQQGGAIANLFGIGLGSGYRPWGKMAGEPGFNGQQNSLWLYRNGLGEVIYQGVSAASQRAPGAAAAQSGRALRGGRAALAEYGPAAAPSDR
ncbi:MAG TPA: hypothetical protein VE397_12430 [Stellaceae bacterium]|nr:hypothetical protein [Stellaceae bacterium]